LTPENVADAIRQVRTFDLDVSSAVQSAPGWKDPARVGKLIGEVKAVITEAGKQPIFSTRG
jgi:phosphoribosylanthranilate isomerase